MIAAPLEGMNVFVTRERSKAGFLSKLIRDSGGTPIEVPLLTFEWFHADTHDQIIRHLGQFDWIFFTSGNGVQFFMKSLHLYPEAFDTLKKASIGSVGKKTSETLERFQLSADFEPGHYTAEAMAEEFLKDYHPKKVLLVRGNRSRDVLPEFFTENDIPFDSITVYTTKVKIDEQDNLKAHLKTTRLDAITFTSPSTIDAFFSLGGEAISIDHLEDTICVCIGSTTEAEAKNRGFRNIITPEEYTAANMIKKLNTYVEKGRKTHE
ncbi:uroporphyrinogen-III synthase [Virgibacillus sp. MSP4-1]|uniref:uroporphyrinogen-III synthase n=1 Tax=Virgibacillus sp. MSP4-1 TaxID=2700081 RepID=UPI0003A6A3EA|nr:uroporphyrinogen-III synthase [Virgibacillus sp. MSP4-1]QHS22922.1 uroporphyrinogen-III synthase [Virgibacillus sp. MSP4-1]